jgi:hypothetical protein
LQIADLDGHRAWSKARREVGRDERRELEVGGALRSRLEARHRSQRSEVRGRRSEVGLRRVDDFGLGIADWRPAHLAQPANWLNLEQAADS